MNSFGRNFRVTIFGESHGPAIGVTLDGVPAGLPLSAEDFTVDMERRRGGRAKGTTPRSEDDAPEILSGVKDGYTTGSPLAMIIRNGNTLSKDYIDLQTHPRPSHADWVAQWRYGGFADFRGSGHFSGRLTAPLVAAGVVAKKIIGVDISSSITEIGGQNDPAQFENVISTAMADGDSVGGVIECVIKGVPVGVGEPFFDSVESVVSHIMFAIPGIKGIEFGAGFGAARMRGSAHNDPIISPDGVTLTNNAGGIVGGLTNGNPIVFRVAVKPTASISRVQKTLNTGTGQIEELSVHGRHDVCIALRAAVVVEAAAAIALADLKTFV